MEVTNYLLSGMILQVGGSGPLDCHETFESFQVTSVPQVTVSYSDDDFDETSDSEGDAALLAAQGRWENPSNGGHPKKSTIFIEKKQMNWRRIAGVIILPTANKTCYKSLKISLPETNIAPKNNGFQ